MRKLKTLPAEDNYNLKNRYIKKIVFILLILDFVLLAINGINLASDPQWFDTTAYLGEANFISHHGGVLNFYNLCAAGIYKQANQHPLYILILAPFASTKISFFVIAKLLSASIGLVLVISVFLLARRMYGDLIASAAVFGLLLNTLFIKWTTVVACESLLILCSLFCIYFTIKGFKKNEYWIYAGIFAGLAYLTKGTGILFLPGFFLCSFIIYRLRIFKNIFFWLFFILFTLTASPLLIRNVLVYQNPFFNVNNNIISMGQENINKSLYLTFDLKEGVAIWKYEKGKIKTYDETKNYNFYTRFLSSLHRFPKSFYNEAAAFFDSLNIKWAQKLHYEKLIKLSSLFLFLLFILGIITEKNKKGKLYFLIILSIFLLALFSLPLDRYFLPLFPFMWIYIALGFFSLMDFLVYGILLKTKDFNLVPISFNFLISCIILSLGLSIRQLEVKNPFSSVDNSEARNELLNWLRKNLKKDDLYSMGINFNWQLEKGTWILPPRTTWGNFPEFNSFLKKHNVSYVIVDTYTLNDFKNPINIIGESLKEQHDKENYFIYDTKEGIVEKKKIENWNLVFWDRKRPVDFLIYKIN